MTTNVSRLDLTGRLHDDTPVPGGATTSRLRTKAKATLKDSGDGKVKPYDEWDELEDTSKQVS